MGSCLFLPPTLGFELGLVIWGGVGAVLSCEDGEIMLPKKREIKKRLLWACSGMD